MMTRYWALEESLWPKGPTPDVWMIVDCARDQQKIFRFLLACHLEHRCLYSGHLPPVLEMAAPYLIQLDHESAETRRLIELSWGNSWGLFLRSGTSLTRLRRHLRQLLMVRDTTDRRLVFRYYDPRVLRAYLPTCNGDELRTVFGPIESFWTEDRKEMEQLLEFRLDSGRLVKKALSLHSPTLDPSIPAAKSVGPTSPASAGEASRTNLHSDYLWTADETG
jgi:hypothetical protein